MDIIGGIFHRVFVFRWKCLVLCLWGLDWNYEKGIKIKSSKI